MENNLYEQAVKQSKADILDLGRTQPVFIDDEPKDDPKRRIGSSTFHSEAYTAEDVWILNTGANVFTVPPEQISPEEFSRYEARAVAFLEGSYDVHAREEQPKDPWAQLTQVPAVLEPRSRPRRQQKPVARVSRARRKREALLTALTLLTVVIMFVLLIGAAILMRGA